MYVHTNDARAITEAVHFKRDVGIERMAIVGGYDAYLWWMVDLLRENDVADGRRSCPSGQSVHSLPRFADDDIDLPFKFPKATVDGRRPHRGPFKSTSA